MTIAEKEKVRQLRFEGSSYTQIASTLGISINTIKSHCKRNRLPCGGTLATPEDPTRCRQCGKRLSQKPNRKPRRFCCDQCRRDWWKTHNDRTPNRKAYYHLTCAYCGSEFESYVNHNRKYCGHACYIEDRFMEARDERVAGAV